MKADRAGYVQHINALEVGLTSVDLGAGRAQKGDPIDYAVGILLHVKVADRVEAGQTLFTIHANDQAKARRRRRTPAPRDRHRRRSGEAAAVVLRDCETEYLEKLRCETRYALCTSVNSPKPTLRSYRALRLRSLRESPHAFTNSFEEFSQRTLDSIAQQLSRQVAREQLHAGRV